MAKLPPTEKSGKHESLHLMSVGELVSAMNSVDIEALEAVSKCKAQVEEFINALVPRMEKGGRLFYVGAGTSGRLGVVDASECPPTFGVEHGRVLGLIAGGDSAIRKAVEGDLIKRANLMITDSVHGPFKGTIRVVEEEDKLIINGNEVKVIYASNPSDIDYTEYGINNALLIDNTGVWRNKEGLGTHLNCNGISKVLLTAPAKEGIKNIVHGINNEIIEDDSILGAASCTTNAIVPTLKVLNDEFSIVAGHIESVHSYTNDQNLIDNFHKKERRGRSAALNMVITETGAGKAVGQVLPELIGKLTANAVRVPTPNVSLAIMNLQLGRDITVEEVNDFLRQKAFHSDLKEQIGFTNSPEVVSTDFVGDRHAGIIDSAATLVNGDKCVLYVWYDNEYGYTAQLLGLAKEMVGLTYQRYPNFGETS